MRKKRLYHGVNIAIIASFVVLFSLYVRSYQIGDSFSYGRAWVEGSMYYNRYLSLSSYAGLLTIDGRWWELAVNPRDVARWGGDYGLWRGEGFFWNTRSFVIAVPPPYLGFNCSYSLDAKDRYFALRIPHWFPLLLCGICIFRYSRKLRTRALGDGTLCENCGYDLRATPERCPECGQSSSTDSE
jgi:hypothetical protein